MTNILDKYSFDQKKIDSLYLVLTEKLKLNKEKVKSLITKGDDGSLIRLLSKHNLSNEDIRDAVFLRNYEIEISKTAEQENENIDRDFEQASVTVSRKYFTPAGEYQYDSNGLITTNAGAICSSSCQGVLTGKFLDFVSTDSLLSYSFVPGQGFTYSISSLDQDSLAGYVTNVVNIDLLQGIGTSNVRANNIDVNYDGLDDIVISVVDSNYNSYPVLLLNDKIAPFTTGYQLSDCASGNGAVQVNVGYFFGTSQPGGLWCQYASNIGIFYKVNINTVPNIAVATAVSNWCENSVAVVLDFNGDKYDDALCLGASKQQLFLGSKGLEMVSATSDSTGNLGLFAVSDIVSESFATGDFDGNGKDDLLRMDSTGKYYLYLSSGRTFFDYKKGKIGNDNLIEVGGGSFCDLSSKLVAGKFNYDQKSDLWCSSTNADKLLLSTLESDRILPKVKLLLTYQNFNLNIPTDLSGYRVNLTTTKNFVNALDQGPATYNANLELNIGTTNYIDSYRKDVIISNAITSGRVVYASEYDEYNKLFNSNHLEGYVLDRKINEQRDFDVFTSQKKVSANILTPWDSISLSDNVNFSVYPNKCVTAQLKAFTYKDVSSFYTAEGVVSLFDEQGFPLSGQRLVEVAQSIINKPVSLTSSGQAIFNTTGHMLFTMPYQVESSVLPCASLSSLQTVTGLPKAIVKITYDNFVFTTPNLSSITTKVITSQEKLQNNKQYGQASFSKKLELEVNLNQKIDGFTLDIKNNDIVKAGEVIYLKGFGEIQLAVGTDLSGYHVEMDRKDYLKHSWSTPASQISAELFSTFNSFKITSDAEIVLVPGQCSIAKISATLYQAVPFAYTATGHFSATDENGYPITGDMLEAIAQNVISKSVSLDSLGEGVFSTSGTLSRNLVGNVITDIDDCAV